MPSERQAVRMSRSQRQSGAFRVPLCALGEISAICHTLRPRDGSSVSCCASIVSDT